LVTNPSSMQNPSASSDLLDWQDPYKYNNDPKRLRRLNWGAFVLTPFWALANGLEWWFIFSFIPGVSIIARFYMLWYGNRLAYEKSRVRSIQKFMDKQEGWSRWGEWIMIVVLCLIFLVVVMTAFM
jgi:hypothetical protein